MKANNLSAFASVKIHAAPSDVCRAFVDASEMSNYWFTRYDSGLRQGETVRWFLGDDADALSFDVYVEELLFPHKLVVNWPGEGGELRQVKWLFREVEGGGTALSIEETGFTGSDERIVESVVDSTRGFNQVILAAKAFIEYGVQLNVVTDRV